jgi:PEP-CTERM motif
MYNLRMGRGWAMKNLKRLVLACAWAVALSVLAEGNAHANLIYNVDRNILGQGSIVGTIETDGTLGVLDSANVVDWTLTVKIDVLGAFTLLGPLSGNNSDLVVIGSSFTATSTDLLFDFSNTTNDVVSFRNPSSGSAANAWCMNGPFNGPPGPPVDIGCGFVPPTIARETLQITSFLFDPNIRDVQSVATRAVPEPGTLALFGAGLAGLAVIRYRRKGKAN